MTRPAFPTRLAGALALLSLLLLVTGCAHGQFWGAKSSGQPARFGGNVTIPLGK